MLRLPSQQGVKALCKRLRNPLRNPVHARYVHIQQAPYSGPPSYATIARRFSSQPNPLIYFTYKRAKEAIERNEFIDIHDIGGVDPKDYNVLLTDINDNMLRSNIAEIGQMLHMIFPCIVSFKDKAHWVFFIVDTGSPLTFISSQAAEVLGFKSDGMTVMVAGCPNPVYMSPPDSHFSDINLLGADFCSQYIPVSEVDRNDRTAKVYFGNDKWEVKAKPKV